MTETGTTQTGTSTTGTPPITLTVNGEARTLPAGTTLAEVVAQVSAANTGVAAAVDEAVVPRGSWPDTPLGTGNRVEILTAVQGG